MKKKIFNFLAVIFLGSIVACGTEKVPSIEPSSEEVTSEENLQDSFDINPKEPNYLNEYESHIYLANLDDTDDLERIYIVNKSPDNSYYQVYVKNSKDEEIWSRDFGTSHAGWGAVFLCTIDEKEYLLEYSPYVGQGFGAYRYFLVDFQNNERNVVAEKVVEFELYTQDNVEERIAFMEEVNALIEQSQVIMSTLEGKAVIGLASAEEFKMTEEQLYYKDAE